MRNLLLSLLRQSTPRAAISPNTLEMAEVASTDGPPLMTLPNELLVFIFSLIDDPHEKIKMAWVNQRLRSLYYDFFSNAHTEFSINTVTTRFYNLISDDHRATTNQTISKECAQHVLTTYIAAMTPTTEAAKKFLNELGQNYQARTRQERLYWKNDRSFNRNAGILFCLALLSLITAVVLYSKDSSFGANIAIAACGLCLALICLQCGITGYKEVKIRQCQHQLYNDSPLRQPHQPANAIHSNTTGYTFQP